MEERGADILGSKVCVCKEESLDRWRRGGWARLASAEGFGTRLKRRKGGNLLLNVRRSFESLLREN